MSEAKGEVNGVSISGPDEGQARLERFPQLDEDVGNTQTEKTGGCLNEEDSRVGASPVVDPALIETLSQGFLATVMPDLQASKGMLEELMRNQRVLIDTVEQENSKFDECQSFRQLEEIMIQARLYHGKLISIKKEMNSLHEKSARLKKRAVKLQQQKQKEELQRAHQRDKEAERERMLVAKPAARKQATPPANTDTAAMPNPTLGQT